MLLEIKLCNRKSELLFINIVDYYIYQKKFKRSWREFKLKRHVFVIKLKRRVFVNKIFFVDTKVFNK